MKISVYNQEGKETEAAIVLPKEIFEIKLNSDLVHQVVVSLTANKRQILAHAKDRGEVRGGGRKPWRQKGTGRARHGSRRSPLWKGGGVTFGPIKDKVFKKKINKKIKKKALFMVLSEKVKNNLLIVLDELNLEKAKTKQLAETIKKLPCKKENSLIVLPEANKNIFLAGKNNPQVKVVQARNLNILDLLSFKYLIMPKGSIKKIKETFINNTEQVR